VKIQNLPSALAGAAEGFGKYLVGERARSPHTVRAYLSDLDSLLVHVVSEGISSPEEIELGSLRRWLGAQSEAGISRSTLARRAATARAFTAWALREELIAVDPALRLKAPKREGSLPGVLNQQQVSRLLADLETTAADGQPVPLRNRAMVELLYATGVRVGELVGMDVDDLDPDRRTLRVLGKGNKERTVPYGLPAAVAVDDWLRRGRPRLATDVSGPALFLGLRGKRVDQRQVRAVVAGQQGGAGRHLGNRTPRLASFGCHPFTRRRC
jgi:integrase/recombinase XerC